MNQFKPVIKNPFGSVPKPAQKIAKEFERISKLSDDTKDEEAMEAAKQLLARYPQEGTANFIMCMLMDKADNRNEAIRFGRLAVKFAPEKAMHKCFLGKLYMNYERIELAYGLLQEAYRQDNTQYQAPMTLAYYHLEAGQSDKALPYFEQAIRSAPEEAARQLRFSRAHCYVTLGRIDEAEKEYLALQSIDRMQITCQLEIAALHEKDADDSYSLNLKALLQKSDLTPEARTKALLSLGKMCENKSDFDAAFQFFQSAKEIPAEKEYENNLVEHLKNVRATFTSATFEKFTEFGDSTDKPIFVVGMPRTGTTLTEQILGAHPEMEGVGELKRFLLLMNRLRANRDLASILHMIDENGPANWRTFCSHYTDLINVLAPSARHTIDKLPHNFLWLGIIHLAFPNAKIIHCLRNPLDTFISAFQNAMSDYHSYSFDQQRYGEYYCNYLQLMDHWNMLMPDAIHTVRYEDLTRQPEIEIRKMLEFIGVPWSDACMKFNERKSTVKTFSLHQVRGAINTRSVARWRNYEKHLSPVMAILRDGGVDIES